MMQQRQPMTGIAAIRPATTDKRQIAIIDLLHWAFARECAQLDFEHPASAMGYGYASGTALILQHEQLGCRVDGGGRSEPHPGADLVASAVAVLPEGRGGRGMAIRIAELARVRAAPHWHPNNCQRVYPSETRIGSGGERARIQSAEVLGQEGWPPQPRRNRKQVLVHEAVPFCPVVVRPTGHEIAYSRRSYLDWWFALLELRDTFRLCANLSAWEVTFEMPPQAPWKETC